MTGLTAVIGSNAFVCIKYVRMKRKLVQAGGSLAVTLPAEVVEEFGLEKGMAVDVTVHPRTGAVTIRPGVKLVGRGRVTKDFARAVDDLLDRRAELYRRLAR
jgi:antitoxin component of MazEF toxin-antitoxin module